MKTKLSILLATTIVAMPLFSLTVFAADGPPGIDLGFGSEQSAPPEVAVDSNPQPPSGPEPAKTLPPQNSGQSGSTPTTTTATPKVISKSGPEMAILLVPSLIGGYLYRRRRSN